MIGQGLYSFLSSQTPVITLAQDRIYPVAAPHDASYPFAVYARMGCLDVHGLKGPTGLTRVRMQIDCYGTEFRPAELLADAIRQVLNGYKGIMGPFHCEGCWRELVQDMYHQAQDASEKGLFRVRQDFVIGYKEIT